MSVRQEPVQLAVSILTLDVTFRVSINAIQSDYKYPASEER